MSNRNLVRVISSIVICAPIYLAEHAHANEAKPNYEVVDTAHLPGATRWDLMAFDGTHNQLYITRGDSLDVVDVKTKEIVGSVATNGAHGVVLAEELGRGFVTNGKANTATVFDLTTLKPTATIPTGTKPDAIAYEATTKHIFIADADSADLTVVDAKTNKVVGTIKLGGAPEYIAVDGKGHLYVNLEDKAQIVAVDTHTLKVKAHYDLGPQCEGPTGLALDKTAHHLFSVCASKVGIVVDARNGKIIDTLAIGAHSDAAAFNPSTGTFFSSNGDGTLTVINKANDGHYKVAGTVQTQVTARTMALDSTTGTIYLSAAEIEGMDPPTAQHPEPHVGVKPDTFMILTVRATK